MPAQSHIRGATMIVLAEACFVAMGISIRFLSGELSNEVIVLFRNLFALMVLTPWLLRHGPGSLRTQVFHIHLLRSLAGLGAMYCFFYAILYLPLADAMLFKLSAPLFIPFVALLWLGEGIPWPVRWAVLLGFSGVALILNPQFGTPSPVVGVALLGGLLAALAQTSIRRATQDEPPLRIVFYFALISTAVSAVPMAWAWHLPNLRQFFWLTLVALFATLAQLFLTRGYGLAPAGRMGPYAYSSVIFGAIAGWLLWDEALTWPKVLGATMILYAGWLAGRRGGKAPPPTTPAPPDLAERYPVP